MAYAEPDPEKVEGELEALARVETTERAEAAIALMVEGMPWSDIAQALGYSSGYRARCAVERALAATVGDDERAKARVIASRRLSRLLQSVWPKAAPSPGEELPEDHLAYVRAALALIDREIRLQGLDAPTEVNLRTPSHLELENWMKTAMAQFRAGLPEEYDVIDAEEEEE